MLFNCFYLLLCIDEDLNTDPGIASLGAFIRIISHGFNSSKLAQTTVIYVMHMRRFVSYQRKDVRQTYNLNNTLSLLSCDPSKLQEHRTTSNHCDKGGSRSTGKFR